MISCHSSAGRASQGGHARLTGRSGAQCGLPLLGGRAGFSWGGSRGRTRSHEPLQWALQGVLGATLPPGGCLAPWGAAWGYRWRSGLGVHPSGTSLPARPSLPCPAPYWLILIQGEYRSRSWTRGPAFTHHLSLGADEAQFCVVLATGWVLSQ